jgi:hypothetical protein
MSGTPFTEYWGAGSVGTPFNREYYREGMSGNVLKQMRTPFLWFTDLYVEYGLRMGKTSLNFSINIDNLFNAGTVTAYYKFRDFNFGWISDDDLLAKNWDLADLPDFIPDPRFLKPEYFYPPFAARLGMRLSF